MLFLRLFSHSKLITIGLRCLECGTTFSQRAECLLLDLGTVERKQRGEQVPFSQFFVPARVVCPHCQAEDRYDLSGWQHFRVTLALIWMRWIPPGPDSWFQAITLGTRDGRIMHPFEMRAWYAKQVADNPRQADLRLRYANTLRTLGRAAEAEEQYRATLNLEPRQTEALINLAALLAQRGEQHEALNYLSRLANLRPKNQKQRQQVSVARDVLTGKLSFDELEIGNPMIRRK